MNTVDKSQSRVAIALGVLQLFIGIMGVAGGIPLILSPSGAISGFKTEWLASSPFQDFLIPGIVLLTVNGLGSIMAAILSFRRYRFSGELAAVFGVFLLVWIVTQVWWIGLLSWMQPLFFILAIAELYLALLVRQALQPNARPSAVSRP